MQFAPKSQVRKFVASDECVVWEYQSVGRKASNAVAEINGRYPQSGWAMNDVSDELVYVIAGTGKLTGPNQSIDLAPGDTALVEAGDRFAWEGKGLTVFIPCFPAWTPEQHHFLPE